EKGNVFRLQGSVDGHHDTVKLRWEMLPASGGAVISIGFDFLVAATAASAPVTSSLKPDGVLLQVVERDDVQGHGVRGLEHDLRRGAGLQRLFPAAGAQAPAV